MEQSKTAVEEAKKNDDNVEIVTKGINNSHLSQCDNNTTQSKRIFVDNSEIRRWFVALSPKERMRALAFNDGQFVSVLSSLLLGKASSSVLPTSSLQDAGAVEAAMERTTDIPSITDPVDFAAMVSLADVEQKLESMISTRQSPEPTVSSLSETIAVDQDSIVLSNETDSDDKGVGKDYATEIVGGDHPKASKSGEKVESNEASDAYRIRADDAQVKPPKIETKPTDIPAEREKPSSINETAVESGDHAPDTESRCLAVATPIDAAKVNHIMQNVCAMLPSTVDPNGVVDDVTPVITMNPLYLAKISGEELLFALDEIMFSSVENELPPKFLLDSESSSRRMWLDSLRKEASSTEAHSIPLYMLLLTRFQLSLYKSFRHLKAGADGEAIRVVTPGANTPTKTKENVCDSGVDDAKTAEPTPDKDVSVVGDVTSQNVRDDSSELDENQGEMETTDELVLPAPVVTPHQPPCELDGVEKDKQKLDADKLLSVAENPVDNEAATSYDDYKTMSFGLLLKSGSTKVEDGCVRFRLSDKFFIGSTEESQMIDSCSEIHGSPAMSNKVAMTSKTTDAPAVDKAKSDDGGAQNLKKNDSGWMDESVPESPAGGSQAKKNGKKKKKKKKKKGANADHPAQQKAAGKKEEANEADDAAMSKDAPTENPGSSHVVVESSSRLEGSDPVVVVSVASSFDNDAETVESHGTATSNSAAVKKDGTPQPSKSDAIGSKGGLHVARVEGVGTTCVVVEQPQPDEPRGVSDEAKKETATSDSADAAKEDHSTWETVEVRSRGNRKKSSDRNGNGRFSTQQSYGSNSSNGHSSSKKKASRAAARRRMASRKAVRDILSSVLDAVDEEVRRRRHSKRDNARPVGNKWAAAVARNGGASGRGSSDHQPSNVRKEATTMRDVLVGRQGGNASKPFSPVPPAQTPQRNPDRGRQRTEVKNEGRQGESMKHGNDSRKGRGKSEKVTQGMGTKPSVQPLAADQNTAPTLPETLSAVSANSVNTDAFRGVESRRDLPVRDPGVTRSDSSSGESAEVLKPLQSSTSQSAKEGSPPPPLPTLLSPGNANSASSSVASSLDAPHAVHHHHHHCFAADNENDVGYHLLDVCNRLTREMDVFMNRRAHALDIRRSERGAVLGALQDCLSTLWPGKCNVEMYGSCATQLDLPSSDLDVVICGLDRPVDVSMNDPAAPQQAPSKQKLNRNLDDKALEPEPAENTNNSLDTHQQAQDQLPLHHQHMQMMYGHQLSLNSERVIRLAAELERQSWAVHVKAIPTASVPVIKILADPARLTGAGNGSEWLVQHQMAAQVTAPAGQQPGGSSDMASTQQQALPPFHPSQAPPPWRGADVVNGLLKVDITFEGPEHGGIGSTEFSNRVVQEFCDETGLQPEGTPAVQVLMVLKELLAQRRLNEPFSGGLSSYALLLLVISVLRERAVIRQELERVERQRRMVAAGGVNSAMRGSSADPGPPTPSSARGGVAQNGSTDQQVKSKHQNLKDKNPKLRKHSASPHASGQTLNGKSGEDKNVSTSSAHGSENKSNLSSNGRGSAETVSKTGSSWASIARKSGASLPSSKQEQESAQAKSGDNPSGSQIKPSPPKVSTFADAVAKGAPGGAGPAGGSSHAGPRPAGKEQGKTKNDTSDRIDSDASKKEGKQKKQPTPLNSNKVIHESDSAKVETNGDQGTGVKNPVASASFDSGLCVSPSVFPQGFHDVIEVLCSGETTAGKLLMHFLLFYGQHFDPQSTAIDYSGKHERDFSGKYSHFSPYMQRRTAGSYDPMTGMLTVDPIVVYDPLEGAENNNVARSCFCWSNIRWVFTQSYMTLSNAVEMSTAPTTAQTLGGRGNPATGGNQSGMAVEGKAGKVDTWNGPYSQDEGGSMMVDPSASLLELLLSY